MSARTLAAIASLVVLGLPSAAQADQRSVRLEYTRAPGAERCPGEQVFRDIVGGRMSFDPFREDAPGRLIVTVSHGAGGYRAQAEYRDPASEGWSEEFSLPRDCRSVIHALGSAVAHRLESPAPPPPKASPAPEPPPVPAPAQAPSAAQKKPERPFRIQIGVDGAVGFWMSPADVAFEGAVGFGLRWRVFSLSAEVRGSPPSGAVQSFSPPQSGTALRAAPYGYGVDVSTARLGGAVVPCLHWNLIKGRWAGGPYGCAVIEGGAVFASGTDLVGKTGPYLASGLRLGFEMTLVRWLGARVGTDGLGVILRPALRTEGQPVWIAPRFSLTAGGGLVASFR